MYVCMYVHMYVCMHACMDGWMDRCMSVCTYVFMYVCMYVCILCWREGTVLFNNALNTYYLRFGDEHTVERANPLRPFYWLVFSSKGFLYATFHRQDGTYLSLCYTNCEALAGTMSA